MSKKTLEERIEKTYEVLTENLNTVRAGRANPALLDKVTVPYYGVPTPLKALANVSAPDPRTIVITPFDPKSIGDIEKGINEANIGINPTNDGKMIRLVFPMLTEERRKDLVKQVKGYGDETKVVIRNNRRDAIDKMRAANKKKELTDDLLKEYEEKVQKITDKFTAEVDKVTELKNKELMEI